MTAEEAKSKLEEMETLKALERGNRKRECEELLRWSIWEFYFFSCLRLFTAGSILKRILHGIQLTCTLWLTYYISSQLEVRGICYILILLLISAIVYLYVRVDALVTLRDIEKDV